MTTKINLPHQLLVVIVMVGVTACLITSSTATRTISLERDDRSMDEIEKAFFHPLFPHRGVVGKVIPGFSGFQPGFPSGTSAPAAGSSGSSTGTGAVGSKAGDRTGSSTEGTIASSGGGDDDNDTNNNTASGTSAASGDGTP